MCSENNFLKRFYFLTALSCLIFLALGCSSKPYYSETRIVMGTFVEITCQDKGAIQKAFEEIKKIDTIANIFESSSEVSLLNRQGKIKASPDLFALVKESVHYYSLSQGAFDITIAPVVRIWKQRIKEAGEKRGDSALPQPEEIKSTLNLVGANKLSLNENTSWIKFSQPKMSIDLGGIAKGYAVDKAITRLKELGITSALVNAGGNIYCLGKKGNRKWRIGIQNPRNQSKILYSLDLENQAAATSGDYEQFFLSGKKRYSHIIDPKTGYPVDNGIIAVTIISDSAATCDALSTTVFVLGKEKGLALLKKIGDHIEARIIQETDIL